MSEIVSPYGNKLEDTPVNRAAISLLQEWIKQENKGHFKVQRIRRAVYALAAALRDANETNLISKPGD